MKEFDINLAKQGKPIKTRDGRPARIICFDRKDPVRPIVALVEEERCTIRDPHSERVVFYGPTGKNNADEPDSDLVMDIQHHEGWVNIYSEPANDRSVVGIYPNEYSAKEDAYKGSEHAIATVKIEWEE